ncbi:MAG: DUF6463 family protein [Spirochaetes bacterium]|jgi:hypothetical protein|nr:DUF6463 family protein [Spirochaetota bacterium]
MKITNGKIIIAIGVIHTLFGISPLAFGSQFAEFSGMFFFKISGGVFELPLLGGTPNYETFAAFWYFYFGLLLFPLGLLLDHIENNQSAVPKKFIILYTAVVLIGVYMLPFSGMTVFMLPHAVYMLIKFRK